MIPTMIGDDVRRSPTGVAFRAVDLTPPWEEARTPIVFQHGLGLDGRAWFPWMRRLAASHPVVTIDLRGHGKSSGAWGSPHPDLADYGSDILSVMDHLGLAECHFVGESLGGTVGLFLAAHHAELFRTLTIVSTGWFGKLIAHTEGWADLLDQPDGVRKWSERMTEASLDVEVVDPAVVDWVNGLQRSVPAAVIESIARRLRGVDLRGDLPRINAPVLNLVAKGSPFVADEQNDRLRELVPTSEQVDYWDARHRVFITHAESCTDELLAFLLRHETETGVREAGSGG
jgi:3-oxoadipate enol-lactonase